MKKINSEIADAYNQFGRMYHESRQKKGRLFNEFLEMPAAWALISTDLHNQVVLDAGCGSGIYAKELAKRGAKVIGVDISETMIEIANEEKNPDENIHYQVGNLAEINCQENTFDLVICNYVLENIENVQPVFSEFFRALKPGGHCIYSISHPVRAMANREEMNGREVWHLENYYDRTVRISDFGNGMMIKKFKRTLADYINPAIEVGFTIDKFIEPQPIISGQIQDPNAYDLAMRLPQILLIKMGKNVW